MVGALGIGCVLFGIIAILIGDKNLPMKGGRVFHFFDVSPGMARLRKWLIGLGTIYAGIMIMREAGWF
jgi:hypothetical protein